MSFNPIEIRSPLIDTHAHLDETAFENSLEEVLENAKVQQLRNILTIGTTLQSCHRAIALANGFPQLYAAVGIQPNYVAEAKNDDWEKIVTLAQEQRVLAVGETGLDRYWDYSPIALQSDYFYRHMELSKEIAKPFIVHCREADEDVLEHLQKAAEGAQLSGVMHSFCGNLLMMKECVKLGLHISFAGMVTFKKNDELREVAAEVPLDRLLVETDSPYLAPEPRRGKRNEPALVAHTAKCIADVRKISLDELAHQTTKNACELFGFADLS